MDEEQEKLLLLHCRNGNTSSFNALVEYYQQDVYAFVFRMLHHPSDASDITQQVFVAAFQHISSFRADGSFRVWLFRIANNRVYDHWRRTKKHILESLDHSDERSESQATALPDISFAFQPEQRALSQELQRLLETGLQQLPLEQRQAIILCDIHGYQYNEIADITSTSIGTVRSRIARGRYALRTFLLRYPELLPESFRHTS